MKKLLLLLLLGGGAAYAASRKSDLVPVLPSLPGDQDTNPNEDEPPYSIGPQIPGEIHEDELPGGTTKKGVTGNREFTIN